MNTLKRIKAVNVDASPNQMVTVADPTRPVSLVGYSIYNPNSSDVFVKMYNLTSGVVTVGTTSSTYGSLLIPAAAQVAERVPHDSPLLDFDTAITVVALTSSAASANTSPTLDIEVELFYLA